MRQHGVSGFPDPTTSAPSKTGGGPGVVADREGAIFALPATIMTVAGVHACGIHVRLRSPQPLMDLFRKFLAFSQPILRLLPT